MSGDNLNNETPEGLRIDPDINFFGLTNYRNQNRKFGIKTDDRRRHVYVVGKTGMGKTTLLENMVLNDIYAGHGVGLVDPHGDFAEKIINFIPNERINDVVYFNPSDMEFPIGFNILESVKEEYKHLVASGMMGVFKKIWPDVWSARMEYILNNTILALLDFPGTTLLGINRLLSDDDYRAKVIEVVKDPVVKSFWENEFEKYDERFRREAIAPIQNKIGQFLSASIIRNIVAQVKSRINIREIMDQKKIFIMNLSKGRIGEDNSRLLGGMLITKIQLSAMERVDIAEKDRKDFFLYVDEFQNFATESFANILSEARKYRLDLTMAHQYMAQLDETVLAAVIGNVGTMMAFRVGSSDAEILAKEFIPTFVEEDLINLPKFHIYLKLMIDGVASRPFSALTMSPIGSATASLEKVVKSSRERYAVARDKIEEKISRWSGMSGADVGSMDEMDDLPVDVPPAATEQKNNSPQNAVLNRNSVPPKPSFPQRQPQRSDTRNDVRNDMRNEVPRQQQSQPPKPSSPPPSFSQQQMQRPNNPQTFNGGGNTNSDGQGRKRKRTRSSGGGEGGVMSPRSQPAETVMLVDSTQKGISLNQMLVKNNNQVPPQRRQEGNRDNQQQKNNVPKNNAPTTPREQQRPQVPKNISPQIENSKPNVVLPISEIPQNQKPAQEPPAKPKEAVLVSANNEQKGVVENKRVQTNNLPDREAKPPVSQSTPPPPSLSPPPLPTVSPSASQVIKPGQVIKFD
jgi:hypothetical protein